MNKFNITAHKELWEWLMENPESHASEWPEWWKHQAIKKDYSQGLQHNFACLYVDQNELDCLACPFEWVDLEDKERAEEKLDDSQPYPCLRTGSPYYEWLLSRPKEREWLAEKIRDLSVKEGTEIEPA